MSLPRALIRTPAPRRAKRPGTAVPGGTAP